MTAMSLALDRRCRIPYNASKRVYRFTFMAKFIVPTAFKSTARLLDGLADPTRVRILCLLGGQGRMSVASIAGHFTMTRPAISHHLRVMLDSGLLKNQKTGQEVYYWVNCDDIVKALSGLAGAVESCCKATDCCGVPSDEPGTKTRRMK